MARKTQDGLATAPSRNEELLADLRKMKQQLASMQRRATDGRPQAARRTSAELASIDDLLTKVAAGIAVTPAESALRRSRPTAAMKLLDARDEQDQDEAIYGDQVQDIRYQHTVLAQCGLPYKNPGAVPHYQRKNGSTTLLLTPGYLISPDESPILQGLPYGPMPRLLMMHLCTQAIRTQSAEVEVGSSMSALMHDLELGVSGGERGPIRSLKEQLNRLAATRVQFGRVVGDKAVTFNLSPMIEQYEVWFPLDSRQRMLWPTTMRLSDSFFASLQHSAVPLDLSALRGLRSSAMKLDVYTWLAQRLWRIPATKPAVISWDALKRQFSQGGADTPKGMKEFKKEFREALKHVQKVYEHARISDTAKGLELRQSKPPVKRPIEGISTKRL